MKYTTISKISKIFISLVIISNFLIVYISFWSIRRSTMDLVISSYASNVNSISEDINFKLNLYKEKADYLFLDGMLSYLINKKYDNVVDMIDAQRKLDGIFRDGLFMENSSYVVYCKLDRPYLYSQTFRPISEIMSIDKINKFLRESYRSYTFVSLPDSSFSTAQDSHNGYVMLHRGMNALTKRMDAVLAIRIPAETVFGSLYRSDMPDGCYIAYVTPNSPMLYGNAREKGVTPQAINDILRSFKSEGIHYGDVKSVRQGEGVYFIRDGFADGGSVVAFYPDSIINGGIIKVMWIPLSVVFLLLVLSVVVSVMITRKGAIRYYRLISKINRLHSENLGKEQIIEGNDEITLIDTAVTNMIKRINELAFKEYENQVSVKDYQMKLYKTETQMKQLEFDLIQSQVNPHFLYNTLSSVKWSLPNNGNSAAGHAIDSLSAFYRMCLKKENFIHIREEIKIIESYVNIQRFIHNDRFTYCIDIDEEIMEFYCVKLMLQPIVENAVIHGLSAKNGSGILTLTGILEDTKIQFQVSDNGDGFDESTPNKNASNSGFGIKSVEKRLKAYFDEQSSVCIESVKGKGTIVTIEIPAILTPPNMSIFD